MVGVCSTGGEARRPAVLRASATQLGEVDCGLRATLSCICGVVFVFFFVVAAEEGVRDLRAR